MQSINTLKDEIKRGKYDARFGEIYVCKDATLYRERCIGVLEGYKKSFGDCEDAALFTAAGRTEIGGNHTDHQHGHVLAGSVSLSVIAAASKNDNGLIRIQSAGFPLDTVDLSDLSVKKSEYGKSYAIIKGIAAKLTDMGYKLGGMDAFTDSNVLKGSGLSSSAAFEIVVGEMLNNLYCGGELSTIELAKIGQYAENVYFGKPCGLMDQMACAVGGVVAIDFADTENPVVEAIPLSLSSFGYALCIIDSGGNHAKLTDEYAAIPIEMKSVAEFLGKEFLREVSPELFYKSIPLIREKTGDRAVLRAMHFFEDDERVGLEVAALKEGDFEKFLALVTKSGHSSYEYLQNVFAASQPQEQAVSIALATCERLLCGEGAYRVHGGGFAGTIQAYVPLEKVAEFKTEIEAVLGAGSCHVLDITPVGGARI